MAGIRQMFDGNSSAAVAMSDIGVYSSILTGRSPIDGNMTTLDFMGIGGSRVDHPFMQDHHHHHQHQEQQIMNPFQHLSHADSSMRKPIWDV